MIPIKICRRPSGKEPFSKWFTSLKDSRAKALINSRILRLATGNFGDVKALGDGVFEMRLHYGAGYRIYFAHQTNVIILLLCGGIKSKQIFDIKKAKELWQEYGAQHGQ